MQKSSISKDYVFPGIWQKYADEYADSLRKPEEYFGEIAKRALYWKKPWEKYFEYDPPVHRFFIGGLTNYSYLLDVHEKSWRKDKVALYWEDEFGNARTISYHDLFREVNGFAQVLKNLGVKKGDRVGIYMPMVPEAIVAIFAAHRIGALHVIVFSGFGAEGLASRLDDSKSKLLITADGTFRRGNFLELKKIADLALEKAVSVEKAIVFKRGNEEKADMKRGRDFWWHELMAEVPNNAYVEPEWLEANDPIYIMYTSGTAGKPKGIVDTSSKLVWLYANMLWAFDLNRENRKKETWFFTGDIGWAGGMWFTVYTTALFGLSSVFYEGAPDYPKPDKFWELVEKYKATVFYTSPTVFRLCMTYGDEWVKKHDLSSLRAIGSVGEPLNAEVWNWTFEVVGNRKVPIIDTYGQTETLLTILPPYSIDKIPLKPGSATLPVPGIEASVLDEYGQPAKTGEKGVLVYKVPFKVPSIFLTVWGNVERFGEKNWRGDNEFVNSVYYDAFRGYFNTSDAAMEDNDGYFWLLGRADDTLKIAGHRIGTAEIENAFLFHSAVGAAMVVGKPDVLRGELAVSFIVLKPGNNPSIELAEELRRTVRKALGAFVVIEKVYFVKRIPTNRSGKVVRRVGRALVRGVSIGDTSTLDDPTTIPELRNAIKDSGY
ncbi:MAG TPA: acetate--CoA ligase [Candidatus Bathyarchaeia archaeon]|nr:acetate--CoA ligase [Candidatus Bathyarchaeia archaeon]